MSFVDSLFLIYIVYSVYLVCKISIHTIGVDEGLEKPKVLL